jgi:hypothetical protein
MTFLQACRHRIPLASLQIQYVHYVHKDQTLLPAAVPLRKFTSHQTHTEDET